ncbi:MAG: hypothetical protein RR035_03890, partial [Oscillibacter sp.]
GSPEGKPSPAGKKPVIVYIMILFIAAFLLMALSFAMHQRSNTEALGELQTSVSALREVQATQDKNILLQEELGDAQKELDALTEELAEATEAATQTQLCNQALLALHALQQQYSASDFDACRQTLQTMDDAKLPDSLPKDAAEGVTPPHQRYEQLREAVMNH